MSGPPARPGRSSEAADAPSQADTEASDLADTNAALSDAQQACRDAMLVGQSSLNDSRKRLMDLREAWQQPVKDQRGMYIAQ